MPTTDRRRRRLPALLASALVVLLAIPLAAPPAAAAPAPQDFVTMFSEGEYIGQGLARTYHGDNATISLGGDRQVVEVQVSGGTSGDSFRLEFAAPVGEELEMGVYTDAQRYPFHEAGRAGISVSGDGRGCNTVTGAFAVNALTFGADDVPTAVSITYEHRCEGGSAALFGEVVLGVDGGSDQRRITAANLAFPPAHPTGRGVTVPILVVAGPAPVEVGTASIVGHDEDFTIRDDTCSGTLDAGATCAILVRFLPRQAGVRAAVLEIPIEGDPGVVELAGAGIPGTTGLLMSSDEGDYIGGGETHDYSPANANVDGGGDRTGVMLNLATDDGDPWRATFLPAEGDVLVEGETYEATRAPFNGSGPGMDVSGAGRGCNELAGTFRVAELVIDEATGEAIAFAVRFEQHCELGEPALYGWARYRSNLLVDGPDDETPEEVPPGEEPPGEQPPPGGGDGVLFDDDPTTVQRLDVDDPARAAEAVSQARFADDQAGWVLLSREDDFADSLTGSALSFGGPLLLTPSDALPESTAAEIARVLPDGGQIFVLGGTAAIDDAVVAGLRADGFAVVRLAGPSRIETALAVADALRVLQPGSTGVALARAYGREGERTSAWADSVAGGAVAAAARAPLLLTPGDGLHPAVAAWLDADQPVETVLLGGTAALDDSVLAAVPSGVRVEGPERAATAAAIARQLWVSPDGQLSRLIAVNGSAPTGWAFGLIAAGIAADAGAPVVLVTADQLPPATAQLLACDAPEADVLVMGGSATVDQSVVEAMGALDETACG